MLNKWIKWIALGFLVYVVAVGDFNLSHFRQATKTPHKSTAPTETTPVLQSFPEKEQGTLERTISKYIDPELQEKLKNSKTRKGAVETLGHQLLGNQLLQTSKPYSDLTQGTGKAVYCGQEVTVHYLTKLLDGTIIENTRQTGKPVTFRTGEGKVLPGIDSFVVGMRQGGVRKLFLPSKMAYDAEGFAHKEVPPGIITQGEVELLGMEDSPFDSGAIQVFKKKEGVGETSVACRDVAKVNLVVKSVDGQILLDTKRSQNPLSFQIGQGDVPFGLEQAVLDMKQGEEKTLILAPALLKTRLGKAFKDIPVLSSLPEGQTLLMDVALLSIYKHYQ